MEPTKIAQQSPAGALGDSEYVEADMKGHIDSTDSPEVENRDELDRLLDQKHGQHANTVSVAHEKPKVALQTSLWRTVHGHGLLVHATALACTAVVVQLSFRSVYWSDEAAFKPKWYFLRLGPTATFNILQFGAKLHEIFIVASLSLIVMHVVRRMLIGDGVSFGLLAGAYQVGSAEYFVSSSYLSPLLYSIKRREGKAILLALFIGAAAIFANMVGPSSAIAMIPNLSWWRISNPFDGHFSATYITRPTDEAFPIALNSTEFCRNATGRNSIDFKCPAGGHTALMAWVRGLMHANGGYQLSMNEPLFGNSRRLLSLNLTADADDNRASVVATTLGSGVTALVGLFWTYIHNNQIGMAGRAARPRFSFPENAPSYSPLVQVECTAYNYNESRDAGKDLYFPNKNIRMFTKDEVQRDALIVPPIYWNYSLGERVNQYTTGIHFNFTRVVGLQTNGSSPGTAYNVSIGAVTIMPQFTNEDNTEYQYYIVPCMVDARWAASSIDFDPMTDNLISTNLSSIAAVDFLQGNEDKSTPEDMATYGISDALIPSSQWGLTFDTPLDGQEDNVTHMRTLLHPLNNNTGRTGFPSLVEGVTAILAAALTDGISRSNYNQDRIAINNGTAADDARNTSLIFLNYQNTLEEMNVRSWSTEVTALWPTYSFRVDRYGWGYGLGEPTVQFGVTVLLIHAAMLVVYFAYMIVFRLFMRGWVSRAWADLGELLALAMLSRPPGQLQNTGAGIDSPKTWTQKTRVRERAENEIEILVGPDWQQPQDDGLSRLKAGKSYR